MQFMQFKFFLIIQKFFEKNLKEIKKNKKNLNYFKFELKILI